LKRAARRPGGTWPRIRARRSTKVSPWMSLIARTVEFAPGAAPQVYHAVEQDDYVAIVARNRAGKIAIVRQYRPALETYTWELPAGLVDPGETPAQSARRELFEETGVTARTLRSLGEASPCTGRLNNRIHSFFVEADGAAAAGFKAEPGIMVKWVALTELVRLIRTGQFVSQLHLGALMLAELRGLLKLPRGGR
jgi:ADP-ribose diphosphatase